MDLRLPELSGGTEAEQLKKLQSYLYSLAGQLQFAFDTVDQKQEQVLETARAHQESPKTPAQTFAAIKSLIIKSADIVESYTQEIERSLSGKYTAISQFGTFQEETNQRITENSQAIQQNFTNIQSLITGIAGLEASLLEVNAYIRTGLLYYREDSFPVYGVEIGQKEYADGVIRFHKYARLTSEKLSFYDASDREVAYISDFQLHITEANIHRLSVVEANMQKLFIGSYCWELGSDGHLTLT